MVGAFGVGRMTNIIDDGHTNSCMANTVRPIEPPHPIARGGEIGRFELGSSEPGQKLASGWWLPWWGST